MPSVADIPIVGGVVAAHPVLSGIAVALIGAWFYLYVYRPWSYKLGNLPGPKPTSLVFGNLPEILKAPPSAAHAKWMDEYGSTIVYSFMFGGLRLCSNDPVFLGYVMKNHEEFIKPPETARFLGNLLGNGVLVAEHDAHKRQRRLLNPAFAPVAVRGMMPMFYDKADELRNRLMDLIEDPQTDDGASPTPPKPEDQVKGGRKIDVMKFLGQATIDVIGLAGFGYDFESLSHKENELANAFRDMFKFNPTPWAILADFVPILKLIRETTFRRSLATTVRVGKQLMDEKKRAVNAMYSGEVEKGTDIGKDLLSLVIRANMASDLRPEQRMSDDEVLAQIRTFMLAGNETSSTALTWLIWRLSENKQVQDRLRAEVMAVADERPSLDEINALPLLDKCVHESLRLDNPVAGTIRQAYSDQVIPLGEPIRGRDGSMMSEIHVKKGTTILVPIMAVNRSKQIWGDDAEEFNPDRFDVGGIPRKVVPGVYGNLMTFLGGHRNCIGYRFALAEIKAMMFVLMRAFEFDPLPSKPEIEAKSSIVMRPRVVGEEDAGLQMPLIVRPLEQ